MDIIRKFLSLFKPNKIDYEPLIQSRLESFDKHPPVSVLDEQPEFGPFNPNSLQKLAANAIRKKLYETALRNTVRSPDFEEEFLDFQFLFLHSAYFDYYKYSHFSFNSVKLFVAKRYREFVLNTKQGIPMQNLGFSFVISQPPSITKEEINTFLEEALCDWNFYATEKQIYNPIPLNLQSLTLEAIRKQLFLNIVTKILHIRKYIILDHEDLLDTMYDKYLDIVMYSETKMETEAFKILREL